MAYIDLTRVTDPDARDIIERDPAFSNNALWNAEKDTKAIARFNQVKSGDIPLEDGSGDLPAGALTSEPLYNYCEYRFLYHLFASAMQEEGDLYNIKGVKAERDGNTAKTMVTTATICSLDNEVTDRKSRSQDVPLL
jgi:hypothetical protein